MRVLVACEFSGTVRRAFRALGHDAWSCDILPAADGDAHHIQGDLLDVLNDGWDGAVLHPPCTYLANSGVRWLYGETKATALWLKGLPPLAPTQIVDGRKPRVHFASPGPNRWAERSITLPGIAEAMARQWGGIVAEKAAA